MMDMDSMPYSQGGLTDQAPCSVCGRNFNPDVLPRHEQACSKISQKRKVFDSTKQRHRGTELEHFLSTHKPSTPKQPKKNKRGWREKHTEFVQSLRAARNVSVAIKDGRPAPPPVPTAPNPDYVLCPYCQRRFEENTAERHIPFCKEKASRIVGNTPGARAAKGLQKRLCYKPPAPKRQSQVNRDSPSSFSTPPGASVVMRNSNFSQTYTFSPDHSPAPSSTPTTRKKTRSKVPVPVIRNPTVPKRLPRPQQYNADAYSPTQDQDEVDYSDDSTLSPEKKTAFSKVHSPTSDAAQSSTSPSQARKNRPSSSSRHLRNSASSRRLLAALEYSESSFDNEEHIQQRVSNDHSDNGAGKGGRRHRATHDSRARQPAAEHDSHTDSNGSQKTSTRRPQLPPARGRRVEDIPIVYHHDDGLGTARGAKPLKGIHQLNQYGMPMSKYCYECGFKFPVPQAKYCCECGTKRI